MTTQVKPLVGGAFTTVTQTTSKTTSKTTNWGITLPVPHVTNALRATNEWINCGGVGTAAVRAQAAMAAIGLTLQEI
jgi:hypothetical protein